MDNLPIAAALATRLVEQQFTYGEPTEPARPVAATVVSQPVRRTRVAVAAALERASRAVAPDGYRVAH